MNIRELVVLFLISLYTSLSANIINIDDNTKDISILKNSQLFMDKDSQKNISDILRTDTDFTPISTDFINFGYVFKDTIWIKFTVKNKSDNDILKYLVIDSPNIDIINLYFYKNKRIYVSKNGIFERKQFQSELSFSFPLSLKSHETRTYYLEVKAITHSLHFSLKIKDYKTFKNDDLHHQLILSIFFSILSIIIIYNVIIYINTKNTIYIYYSFFIFSVFIHQFSIRGMIAYFLPSNPEIITMQAYIPIYNLSFAIIAMFIFTRKFLNLYKYKTIYFVLKLFILTVICICLFHSKENYILNYLTLVTLFLAIYMELIGLYLFINNKEKNAKYFFFIWNLSLIGIIGTILYYMGVLSSPIPYLFEITITTEVVLFSIVIGSQIKNLEKEKLNNTQQLLEKSKLASMGEMLQNISHQWRQPLSEINAVAMKIDADYYTKKLDATSLESDIQRIEQITSHMSNTVESFNSYFQSNKVLHKTTLESVVNKALTIMNSSLQNISLKLAIEDKSTIHINISEFIQVILVILNNSIDALKLNSIETKIITIKIKKLDTKSILEIEDNAGGIKEENLAKIFEPYFSTKFKSDGIGIGLYMAKMLIEESLKGSLSVSNTQNGARFKIIL